MEERYIKVSTKGLYMKVGGFKNNINSHAICSFINENLEKIKEKFLHHKDKTKTYNNDYPILKYLENCIIFSEEIFDILLRRNSRTSIEVSSLYLSIWFIILKYGFKKENYINKEFISCINSFNRKYLKNNLDYTDLKSLPFDSINFMFETIGGDLDNIIKKYSIDSYHPILFLLYLKMSNKTIDNLNWSNISKYKLHKSFYKTDPICSMIYEMHLLKNKRLTKDLEIKVMSTEGYREWYVDHLKDKNKDKINIALLYFHLKMSSLNSKTK